MKLKKEGVGLHSEVSPHIEVGLHLGTGTEVINHGTVIEEVNHPTGHHTIPTDPTGLTSHPTHHPTDPILPTIKVDLHQDLDITDHQKASVLTSALYVVVQIIRPENALITM